MRDIDLDAVLTAYIACALWSTTDESESNGGYPLDKNYTADDLTQETRNIMAADVADFVSGVKAERPDAFDTIDDGQIGHDFLLTRNRSGAGFWDRGNGELGEFLADAARLHGEFYLYVGDDGQLYAI